MPSEAEPLSALVFHSLQWEPGREEKGTWRFGRAPDCLTSHACVRGSSSAKPV